MRRWILGLLLLVLGVLGAAWSRLPESREEKRIIGQTAHVAIAEAGMEFLGRVDTGAASTSVHAESVQVEGEVVSFVLVNRVGERVEMQAPLVTTRMVRNPEGRERRLFVELTLRHEGLEKRVLANLNDRSGLTYALLLGRNWLEDDFVVDVAHEPLQPPEPVTSRPSPSAESRKLASR